MAQALNNNFDFLRLVFAALVILTHAYPLSGEGDSDWLHAISGGQTSFSGFGVNGFFVMSGYLVFQSLQRSSKLWHYYQKRALRIFPALLVVLLLTVLLAPFVYQHPTLSYLQNEQVWTYIPKNITLLRMQYAIDGVFMDLPYKAVINGSLWTVHYEVYMYIFLSAFFFIKNKKMLNNLILFFLLIVLIVIDLFFLENFGRFKFILSLLPLFLAGSFLAAIQIEKYKYLLFLVLVAMLLFPIAIAFGQHEIFKLLVFPVLIIGLGLQSFPLLNKVGERLGDLSYGIYIYAFPIQQSLVHYFQLSSIPLMFASFGIAFVFAYFSWHWIEAPALKWKKKG